MAETSSVNTRAVDSAVQPCPLKHYFSVALQPSDAWRKKPAGWPAEKRHPYAEEPVTVTLAGLPPAQKLGGSGRLHVSGLPPGSASVAFEALYKVIEKALEDGRQFKPD